MHISVRCLTLVEVDSKAPFTIATSCSEECYSFYQIAPLTLHSYLTIASTKQGGIKYSFLSLWYDLIWN